MTNHSFTARITDDESLLTATAKANHPSRVEAIDLTDDTGGPINDSSADTIDLTNGTAMVLARDSIIAKSAAGNSTTTRVSCTQCKKETTPDKLVRFKNCKHAFCEKCHHHLKNFERGMEHFERGMGNFERGMGNSGRIKKKQIKNGRRPKCFCHGRDCYYYSGLRVKMGHVTIVKWR
ncbi:hypothetical protein LX32DRAFT_645470 [Colletotrichum zoysiae]|uniref:Uncharacterized protein n=1 Tax=Colletotrichum zoysiae TaxID=1216348 RepID=A0AAD9H4W7_9PEZI|nr:hypothetical protein LX32DRAFT_645470 [Colletotrichum zoysiae]